MKKKMLNKIRDFLVQMEPYLLDAGVKEGYLDLPLEAEKLDGEFIKDGLVWIEDIYSTTYGEVLTVKGLLSEELWQRYKSWGTFTEHREVKMLDKALKKLRAQVVSLSRPNLFKKGKVNAALKKQVKS